MTLRRLGPKLAIVLLLIALGAAQAWAGKAIVVGGLCLDEQSRPVAGVIVSDERAVTRSDAEGAFSLGTEDDRLICLSAPDGQAIEGPWWLPASQVQGPLTVRLRSAALAGPLRLAIVSDPHLFDPSCKPDFVGLTDAMAQKPMEFWAKAVNLVAQSKPDLTVALGDMCFDADKQGPAHAQAQMALAAKAAAMLPQPWRSVPGNHDVRYDDGAVHLQYYRAQLGPARHVYLAGGVALIMFDNIALGQRPDGKAKNCGGTSPEALAWLEELLEVLPADKPLVLLAHFPMASAIVGSNPLHKSSLLRIDEKPGMALRDADQNRDKALALLQGRRLAGWFNGHEHIGHVGALYSRQGAISLATAPAICGRWWAGDMEWGPLSFAPGWLEVSVAVTADGVTITPVMHAFTPALDLHP